MEIQITGSGSAFSPVSLHDDDEFPLHVLLFELAVEIERFSPKDLFVGHREVERDADPPISPEDFGDVFEERDEPVRGVHKDHRPALAEEVAKLGYAPRGFWREEPVKEELVDRKAADRQRRKKR